MIPEYLDLNRIRAYPFKSTVSKRFTNKKGTEIILPDSFLLEARFIVNFEPDCIVYLKRLEYFSSLCKLIFAFKKNTTEKELEITFDTSNAQNYYVIHDINLEKGINYLCIIDIQNLPFLYDIYESDENSAALEPVCIISFPFQTSIFKFINQNSEIIKSGVIELKAGSQIIFEEKDLNTIEISAGPSLDTATSCGLPPLRTINGVKPDSNGNLTLIGEECLQIIPSTNALIFKDLCAQPCMSCDTLEELTSRIQNLETQILQLNNALYQFQQLLNQLQDSIKIFYL